MKCAIMQPTYLPWPGYFNLIDQADYFIFLDDVKIEKQSWQTRNRLFGKEGPLWLTVPIEGSRLDLISEVKINDRTKWRKKHLLTLSQTYAKHPYGKQVIDLIQPLIEDQKRDKLSDLSTALIMKLAKSLNIESKFYHSSALHLPGKRSEKLLNILSHFNCREYLSPVGSKGYLEEDGCLQKANVDIYYQDFQFAPYRQHRFDGFQPMLSVIDLIANIGFEKSREWIENGWKLQTSSPLISL